MTAYSNHDTQPSVAISRQAAPALPPARRLAVWPLVAFWAGTALLFAVGGVLNAVRFAEILLRARGDWQSLSAFQSAWLSAAFFLVVCGVISLALALLLAGRLASGLYGSLLFGLLLTLLGPLAALLTPEPNYFGAVCGGLLPAAVVLFTLAVLPGLIRE